MNHISFCSKIQEIALCNWRISKFWENTRPPWEDKAVWALPLCMPVCQEFQNFESTSDKLGKTRLFEHYLCECLCTKSRCLPCHKPGHSLIFFSDLFTLLLKMLSDFLEDLFLPLLRVKSFTEQLSQVFKIMETFTFFKKISIYIIFCVKTHCTITSKVLNTT